MKKIVSSIQIIVMNNFFISAILVFIIYIFSYDLLSVSKNHRVLIIIAFFLLYGFILLFLFIHQKIQRKNFRLHQHVESKIARLQLQIVRNQLNPHFTFNALNSLGAFILENNNLQAYNFLTKLSDLIRISFTDADNFTRPLEDELKFVNTYLEIEKMKFKERLDYFISISPEVNPQLRVPKMVLQIYVENALKHGLRNKEGVGRISIVINQSNKYLNIEVLDNGIGREASALENNSTHRGNNMMEEYYQLFNKLNERQITWKIDDIKDDHNKPSGTMITIQIPVFYVYSLNYQAE